MEAWIKSHGIQQNFTVPYTSAHIGHIECLHCILMAKAHTMHLYMGCPPELWDEFYLTANHLQDKTTTQLLLGTMPWQEYYGHKPDYSYMQEIGCKAFILILNKHNPKLYGHSLECILIGYNENAKSYHLYHPQTCKIYSSYHVHFLESHNGHPCTLPSTDTLADEPTIAPQPSSSTVNKPISFDVPDDNDYIPLDLLPPAPPLPSHVPDLRPEPELQPNPDMPLPR